MFFICIYVYFILKLLLSERFAVALLLAVPIDLKKSLQTTNVYILLCNFFLCQRSNKYYLSIYLSGDTISYPSEREIIIVHQTIPNATPQKERYNNRDNTS